MTTCTKLLVLVISAVLFKDTWSKRYNVEETLELDTGNGQSKKQTSSDVEKVVTDTRGRAAREKERINKDTRRRQARLFKRARLARLNHRMKRDNYISMIDFEELWYSSGPLVKFDSCSQVTEPNFCIAKKPTKKYPFLTAFENMLDCFGVETRCADFNTRLANFDKRFWETRTGKKLKSIAGNVDIKKYWFGTQALARDVTIGFMHTFAGHPNSKADRSYKGFHSWVQYYRQKCDKRIKNEDSTNTSNEPNSVKICKNKFDWRAPGDSFNKFRTKCRKGSSTIPFGTKPEYDIALLSLCFKKLGEQGGECTVKMDGVKRTVRVIPNDNNRNGRKSLIKTAYFLG